jgi:hypothetical protein
MGRAEEGGRRREEEGGKREKGEGGEWRVDGEKIAESGGVSLCIKVNLELVNTPSLTLRS